MKIANYLQQISSCSLLNSPPPDKFDSLSPGKGGTSVWCKCWHCPRMDEELTDRQPYHQDFRFLTLDLDLMSL